MQQNSRYAVRYVLLAVVGFLLASVVGTAHASQTLRISNYAIAYDGLVLRCSGNPGTECDTPGY